MMGMLTHPHAKPEGVEAKDATHIISELRMIKESEEIERIRAAAKVADAGMRGAVEAAAPALIESQIAAEAEYIGPDHVHVGMHIEVQRGLPIEDADRIAENVRERLHQSISRGYCVIHVDAANTAVGERED